MKYILFIVLLFVQILVNAQEKKFTDFRDSQEYKSVIIGKQEWMAQNLNYKTSNSKYYNDTINFSNGRLYNWYEAINVCPEGWHLPSDTEWKLLEKYVGMSNLESERKGSRESESIGKKLKGFEWSSFDDGTNDYLFNILPAGFYNREEFYGLGHKAMFWCATDNYSLMAYYRLFFHANMIERDLIDKNYLLSIRCIKD